MKSIRNLRSSPASLPLVADDIVELHAARLLLLCHLCGAKDRIQGLTKIAKLDFFVRYPQFFTELCEYLGEQSATNTTSSDSGMVRFYYGPWDRRYYQVLAFLEGRGLLTVAKEGKTFQFTLTPKGGEIAKTLQERDSFKPLVAQMKAVKRVLGKKTGNTLKRLIYDVFAKEIANKSLGERIAE